MKLVVDDRTLGDINDNGPWLVEFSDNEGRKLGTPAQYQCDFPHWKACRVRSHFPLAGKYVCELGPYDGFLTASLIACGAIVEAFDPRPKALLRSMARCLAFGYTATFRLGTADSFAPDEKTDLIFHSGVLYHLASPCSHLRRLRQMNLPVAMFTYAPNNGERIEEHEGYDVATRHEHQWNGGLDGTDCTSRVPTRVEVERMFGDCGFGATLIHEDAPTTSPRQFGYLLVPH
ncbi:MAG: class I SAM-dependent methyltransferase [Patescibacteria group bacterium]|nr:class I SAM-dependent methyltransferase [Patescibacteria group bacterium]